jgi:hypothetical protein
VRTSSGNDRLAVSKRSCTAVATLFTFCPPGPEARTNASSSSAGSMAIVSVTRSMGRRQAGPGDSVLSDAANIRTTFS